MKNPMLYTSFDNISVILDCRDCGDKEYSCTDKHRWGVCHARCSHCGIHENVTVKVCDLNNYFCYDCERNARA